jgi:hypothetical protein
MSQERMENARAKIRAEGPGGDLYEMMCQIPPALRHVSMRELPDKSQA